MRQVGADSLMLDARAGWVQFKFAKPKKLDLQRMQSVVFGAGYTLRAVEVEVNGKAVTARCEQHAGDRPYLETGAGQKFELGIALPAGFTGPVHLKSDQWKDAKSNVLLQVDHVVFTTVPGGDSQPAGKPKPPG